MVELTVKSTKVQPVATGKKVIKKLPLYTTKWAVAQKIAPEMKGRY